MVLNNIPNNSSEDRVFPFQTYWYRDRWDKLRNILKLDDAPWHTLRHTTASRLVQKGVQLVVVKEIMGHKSIQTTMRYSHLQPANLVDAISVLEK